MNYEVEYGITKYNGLMPQILKSTSRVMDYFNVKMYGVLSSYNEDLTERPAVYMDDVYVGESELVDLAERLGCPIDTFHCVDSDQLGTIYLTHEISAKEKVNKVNMETFDPNMGNKIPRIMAKMTDKNMRLYDKTVTAVLEETAPYYEITTIDATNILDSISILGNILETDEHFPTDKSEIDIWIPNKYKNFVKQNFITKLGTNMTEEKLRRGVTVSEYDGLRLTFNNDSTKITALTKDCYTLAFACWNRAPIQTETEFDTLKMKSLFRAGGGFTHQYKQNLEDEILIKKIVVLNETTPSTGSKFVSTQAANVGEGFRIYPKTSSVTRSDAIAAAQTDYEDTRVTGIIPETVNMEFTEDLKEENLVRKEADSLGITYNQNISDGKLQERINEFKEMQKLEMQKLEMQNLEEQKLEEE